MTKFFKKFPAEFEQYNPEDEFSDLKDSETYDEDGHYHSYEDKPSLVVTHLKGNREIFWHSHGKLNREDNKPPHVFITKSTYYSSHNLDGQIHSFNNQPGEIFYDSMRKNFIITFYKNGRLHRGDDKPCQYHFNEEGLLIGEEYYENGVFHRTGGLPASNKKWHETISKRWSVKGFAHNEEGPSYVFESTFGTQTHFDWALYDMKIAEPIFNTIKAFQEEKELPFWLAFLQGLELINEAQVDCVLRNNWHKELPLEWNLRSLGITNELFDAKTHSMQKQPEAYASNTPLKALLDIANFNNEANNLDI